MSDSLELTDGSRIGVIGGGPAGAMTAYFLLSMAERIDTDLAVDIYESRDFTSVGPSGCNHCGGVVSESLVQMLATEGINLPPAVVQRGLESYVLHSENTTVRITTPLHEQRIAALFRGSGPRGVNAAIWASFDNYLLELACEKGARIISQRVRQLVFVNGRPVLSTHEDAPRDYDLVVGAVGVNSDLKLFENAGIGFRQPRTAKTMICELHLGQKQIRTCLGNAMHVFLLGMAELEFAALIPKGEYVTACLLGPRIDRAVVERFMNTDEVRGCLPPGFDPCSSVCRCLPRISMSPAKHFFRDRLVLVGDCGVTRLYKDGIGAAYRTAKACAVTALFNGVAEQNFRRHFWPTCRKLHRDNCIGKMIFLGVGFMRKFAFLRRTILNITFAEQNRPPRRRTMSMILWDTFTGSAPYASVMWRGMNPAFLGRMTVHIVRSMFSRRIPTP